MAKTTLLKAEERNETGKSLARTIRKNGQIPCIIYGDKKEPLAASLNANGESVINDLSHLKRGYENFEEKLFNIGAHIR